MLDPNKYPTVINTKRNIRIGGERAQRDSSSLDLDVKKQSLADIGNMVEQITRDEIAAQAKIGNEPNRIIVDDNAFKKLETVQKRAVATFGNIIEKAAIKAVEREVEAQMNKVSLYWIQRDKSGTGDWETVVRPKLTVDGWGWFYRRNKQEVRFNPSIDPPALSTGEALVFRPIESEAVRLGSWANHVIYELLGKQQGFIAAAAHKLKRKQLFREFAVRGGYTKVHASRGETWEYGTPYIVVVARRVKKGRKF